MVGGKGVGGRRDGHGREGWSCDRRGSGCRPAAGGEKKREEEKEMEQPGIEAVELGKGSLISGVILREEMNL